MHKNWGWTLIFMLCTCTASAADILGRGVISTQEWESHPAFSPDGNLLLFVKSDANFGNWKIMEAHRTSAGWSRPVMAAFSGQYLDADPFFAPDGKTLYFISDRPAPGKTGDDRDIWKIERTNERWGKATRLPAPVNSAGQEWFPRQMADGTLYFGSDRKGGQGGNDIYVAKPIHRGYKVRNLGAPVNTKGNEFEFEPAPNGKYAVLMRGCAEDCGHGDLYVTHRIASGWSTPRNLGPRINSDTLEVGPTISRDGETFYWSSARNVNRLGDIYFLSTDKLEKLISAAEE